MPTKRLPVIIPESVIPYMPGWTTYEEPLESSRTPINYDEGWNQVPETAQWRIIPWATVGAVNEQQSAMLHFHLGIGVMGPRRDMLSDTSTIRWNNEPPGTLKWESQPNGIAWLKERPTSIWLRARRTYSSNATATTILCACIVEAEW